MPLNTNLNVSPYFDDFDPTKNYSRILFRPGTAVQARELTQIQSILQDQIENFLRRRGKGERKRDPIYQKIISDPIKYQIGKI